MLHWKSIYIVLAAVLISLSCSRDEKPAADSKNVIVDDLGYEHVIKSVPKTVITLAPNLTEMIYELGVQDKLIGNTTYCNYPPEAKEIENVGDMLSINNEKLLTLKPDIIFITVEGNTKATFDKLKDLGLTIFISNPRDYKGIKKTFRDFGKIFNRVERANSVIQSWDGVVDSVQALSAQHPEYLTMFLVSFQPIMVAGKNTFINEFLEFCNLKNIVDDLEQNYPFLSREEVLKRNPEIILHTQHSYDNLSDVKSLYDEWINIRAVRNNKIYYVDPDLYFRPGPRFTQALKNLSSIIDGN